jgi:dipeptidyl aminopeptidase/acylaminoacyl peptidase
MYPHSSRIISGKFRRYARPVAQVTLTVVAVLAALGAGYRFLGRGGTQALFGPQVVSEPEAGPVGMSPFLELRGFDGGKEVTVFLCPDEFGAIENCVELGKGEAPGTIKSNPIPTAFPDANEIVPATYFLRVGPEDDGQYPARGTFKVEIFEIGPKVRPRSFAGVVPQAIRIGDPEQIARGAPCRAPLFLPDGRLTVGATVVDPKTGVTTRFDLQAAELAWSPVGDKLAILTPDRKEIRLAGPDGEDAVTSVREARGLLSSLSWSPQGDRLAFISQNDPNTRGGPGPPTVRILNATNGTTVSAGPGLAVSWSSEPDLLAVERAGGVIEASTPAGGRRSLVGGHDPAWSADGSLLAYVRQSIEGDSESGWIARADGSDPSPEVGPDVCALSFSPSGDALAVVSGSGENTTLHLRSIDVQR